MPTEEHFAKYPPFPSDVPVVQLECLSFTKLLAGDEAESERLFEACQHTGFFLLNLRGTAEGETMLKHAAKAFKLTEQIHELDQDELKNYKSVGDMKIEDGSPDRMAFYSLSQDDILGNSASRPAPAVVETHRPDLEGFFHHGHIIFSRILSHLDARLGLESGTLISLSPLEKTSGTSLRLLKALPSGRAANARTDLLGHTDLGSITMLFNVVGGLQILTPSAPKVPADSDWRFVRPMPGCALINLGDAMVQWSGGVVRSNMHRVVTAPGAQKGVERLSVAYLLRPAHETSMEKLKGGHAVAGAANGGGQEGFINARDWERMRAVQLVKGENKPESIGGKKPAIMVARGEAVAT
ncbi:MAG: hypothetical protein LQ344_007867 [Seirophora lacunosa]|nr:MAG: hypothetical protein LQ344_007867 [Seirophora lacunosa]